MTTPEKTEQLIEKYLDLKLQSESLAEQMDSIKQRLHELHPDGIDTGTHKVAISKPGRINEKALTEAFPAHDHPYLYSVKPDTKKVRAKFSPEQLEPFLTYSKPSVRIS